MMKFLLVLIVVVAVIWWLRGHARRRSQADVPPQPATAAQPPRPAPGVQPMLTCAHCGVHLPEREAVIDAASTADNAKHAYCSEAHRRAHADASAR